MLPAGLRPKREQKKCMFGGDLFGGGGVLDKVQYGEAPPGGPTPYPFIHHFGREGTPFIYLLLRKGNHFTHLL